MGLMEIGEMYPERVPAQAKMLRLGPFLNLSNIFILSTLNLTFRKIGENEGARLVWYPVALATALLK